MEAVLKRSFFFTLLFVGPASQRPVARVEMADDGGARLVVQGMEPGQAYALVMTSSDQLSGGPKSQRVSGFAGSGRVVSTGSAGASGEVTATMRPGLAPVGRSRFELAVRGRGPMRCAPVAVLRALAAV